jgi:hypothetical protein
MPRECHIDGLLRKKCFFARSVAAHRIFQSFAAFGFELKRSELRDGPVRDSPQLFLQSSLTLASCSKQLLLGLDVDFIFDSLWIDVRQN